LTEHGLRRLISPSGPRNPGGRSDDYQFTGDF